MIKKEKKELVKNYFYNSKNKLLYVNVYDKTGEAHLIIKSVSTITKVEALLKKINSGEYFLYRDIYSLQIKLAMSKSYCEFYEPL